MERDNHMNQIEGPRQPLSTEKTWNGSPRCTATSKQSQVQCKRASTPGMTVCLIHGSGTKRSKVAAARRLADLVDPAITRLTHLIDHADTDAVRLRASEAVLDRAGFPRSVVIGDVDVAQEMLIAKLIEMRDEQMSGQAEA